MSVFALVAPPSAFSDDGSPPPAGTPSIDQYVETVPSGSGGWSAGAGLPRSKPLRPVVAKQLSQSSDHLTQFLKTAATSSTYGAPQQTLSTPANKNQKATTKNEPATSESNPLRAAVGAMRGSGDSHIYWLLAAMIVVTMTTVWAAVRQRSV